MKSFELLAELRDQGIQVADNMRRYSGSFCKSLAECISLADDSNLVKIRLTWPEYWNKYYEFGD